MIVLGSIVIGIVAMGFIWALAADGLIPPPYSGPRTPPAGQPHITRFRS